MIRISSVRIECFRGIPGRFELDLRPGHDRSPGSLLMLGDNGSGKSSIADALEFVLRASLLRRLDPDHPAKRRANSFATKVKPYVELTYADSTRIARGAPASSRYAAGVRKITEPEPAFGQAPIVLRRADILGFWGLPVERRKLVFFDYFRPPDLTTAQQLEAARLVEVLEKETPRLEAEIEAHRRTLVDATRSPNLRLPKRAPQLRAFRERELVPQFGIGKTGRFGEELIAATIQKPYRQLLDSVIKLDKAQRSLVLHRERAKGTSSRRVQAEVEDILEEASGYVSEAFRHISTSSDFIREIQLVTERNSNSLVVRMLLANGEQAAPEDLLSEANLDLLSLLLFIAVAEAAVSHGQAKVLVLDDVFQSVDAVLRDRTARYIFDQLREWQLLVMTHDRLWFTLLAEAMRRAAIPFIAREIVQWRFDDGPTVREAKLDPTASLSVALEARDPFLICSAAGLLLEEVSDRLSWTLGTSVPRRRGDRYTLGDLWPGVLKKLRRSSAKTQAAEVDDSILLRNLIGAHFNEWARSISIAEAERFGGSVRTLLSCVYCRSCNGWLQPGTFDSTEWQCRCGVTRLMTSR